MLLANDRIILVAQDNFAGVQSQAVTIS